MEKRFKNNIGKCCNFQLCFFFVFLFEADKPESQVEIGSNASQYKEKICGETNVMKHLNSLINETSHRVDIDALKKTSDKDPLIKLLKQF